MFIIYWSVFHMNSLIWSSAWIPAYFIWLAGLTFSYPEFRYIFLSKEDAISAQALPHSPKSRGSGSFRKETDRETAQAVNFLRFTFVFPTLGRDAEEANIFRFLLIASIWREHFPYFVLLIAQAVNNINPLLSQHKCTKASNCSLIFFFFFLEWLSRW